MSYLSDLEKILTPEQYKALTKPMQFQAKKSYKGVPQDWQAQILMPLDVSKLDTPKQLAITPSSTKTVMVDVGEGAAEARKVVTPASLDKSLSKLYTPITETNGGAGDGEEAVSTVVGYKSKTPIDVNGVPVYAKYDANGSLTGYEGASNKRLYVNDSTSFKGVWDTTGKAAPKKIVAEGGGFFKGFVNDVMSDPILGTVANVVAFSYGGPEAVAALNATKTAAAGGDLGDVLESGAKAGLLSYGGQQLGQYIKEGAGGLLNGADVGGADTGSADFGSGGGEGVDLGTATGADLSTAYDMGNVGDLGAGGAMPVTVADITSAIATPAQVDPHEIYGSSPSQFGGGGEYIDLSAQSGLDLGGVGASPNTWMTDGTYGAVPEAVPGSTPAGSNITLSNIIDATKAGLLVNAVTGDPLGLGDSGGTGSSGSTGFAQVPIPAEWKSPTYAPIAGPIDLSTILSSQNMLGGTQWQNLPTQRNVTFNDIFAAGQQKTPMGSPVDLNNIVSAILGQTATSQKPA